jgi:hypothetical protein
MPHFWFRAQDDTWDLVVPYLFTVDRDEAPQIDSTSYVQYFSVRRCKRRTMESFASVTYDFSTVTPQIGSGKPCI